MTCVLLIADPTQQYLAFIQRTAATHQGLDPEDLGDLLDYDALCDAHWPIWVVVKHDRPVAWWDECSGNAGIAVPALLGSD